MFNIAIYNIIEFILLYTIITVIIIFVTLVQSNERVGEVEHLLEICNKYIM